VTFPFLRETPGATPNGLAFRLLPFKNPQPDSPDRVTMKRLPKTAEIQGDFLMMRPFAVALLAASFALSAGEARAQAPMYAPPIVSQYDAPPAYGVYLPATVRVTNYYVQPSTYYPIPSATVGYFHPSAAIVAPAHVHYGLFGRTYVRTPFYRVGFWQ
jgi:hypothetical protein